MMLLSAIADDSLYIVTIWKVVFANNSQMLGWIWMKLGRWGWSLAHLQRNHTMGFGESTKSWSQRCCFFCKVDDAPLLPLSFHRFPPNFLRTHVQVVAHDTWLHIPDKKVQKDTPCFSPGYGSRETFCDAYTLSIPWWTSHRFILPGWLLLRDVPFSSYTRPNILLCHGIGNGQLGIPGCGDGSAAWREVEH